MTSTTQDKAPEKKGLKKNAARISVSALFWIAVWAIASYIVGYSVILPSPLDVLGRLFALITDGAFLASVFFTASRIVIGFFAALVIGVLLAAACKKSRLLRTLVSPLMTVMKSVPVASFVILALIWIGSKNLSVFISLVMVTPVIFVNVLSGIDSCDEKILQMARIYEISPLKKLLYIYLPFVFPYFRAGLVISLGLCWKAGVAAELIGVPRGSIGERLYFSKIYLETADLFAWTIVIILISVAFEKLVIFAFDKAYAKFERT